MGCLYSKAQKKIQSLLCVCVCPGPGGPIYQPCALGQVTKSIIILVSFSGKRAL